MRPVNFTLAHSGLGPGLDLVFKVPVV